MKTKILTIGGVAAVLALAGCVEPYPQQPRATMQSKAPVYSSGYTNIYDGYYDGHYGPHAGGYWGPDGAYYYLGRDGNYHRDDRGHYRREAFKGATPFHRDDRHRGTDNRYGQNYANTEGGYYNGYYGPHLGGYWGRDGYYYYLGRDRNYHRDDQRHYRHNAFQGATAFRGGDGYRGDDSRNVPTNISSTEGGYYNGYYGPHLGGYWGRDGYYYYLGRDRNYHRDEQRHYRHNAFQGATPFRGGDSYRGDDRQSPYKNDPGHGSKR
ncbi:MAG: hypothetical protein Q7V31_04990 [Parvibaculum sp.]|uniref:hypothetical protein n=1 Tax=Parvibaculum sp. TaxID=2024848 RepID=UPI00271F119D|nr:hypothetical protein [Parvibaculum sp.]MDO8838263.1 hypothetical protein [Parvibaculum sp.]